MSTSSQPQIPSDGPERAARAPDHRQLLDAILEQMPTGFVVVAAPSGEILFWNKRVTELLGHSLHPTTSVEEYAAYGGLHADGRPYAPSEYPTARALGGEVVEQHLMRYRRGDGRVIWLNASAVPVYDAAGRLTHAVNTFLDVTSQYESEEALQTGRERLRAALDASQTGTFRWDMRTNALEWDENLDRLFGLAPGVTARSLDQFIALVHPDDRQHVIDAVNRCVTLGVIFDEEFRIVWPDGTVRWLYDRGQTIADAAGRPLYMTGACVDVTDRRAQQEQLRVMAETMPQLVWTATSDGRLEYYNDRWYRFTGMPRGADGAAGAKGPPVQDWQAYLHPDDRAAAGECWMRSVVTGEPYETQYRLREAETGKYRWFIGRAAPMRDAVGQIVRWFGTCTEVESQVQAAEFARWLQRSASRLAAAPTAAAVGAIVCEIGCAALGAFAASIAALEPDGRTLRLIAVHGDSPDEVNEEWRTFPLDAPVPMAEVVRTGRPLAMPSPDALEVHASSLSETIARVRAAAAVTLPLLRGNEAIGSVGLLFRTREDLSAEQERFLTQLAQQCADALERARLIAAQQEAQTRTARLLALSESLAGARSVDAAADAAVRFGMDALGASHAAIFLHHADGTHQVLAARGFSPELLARVAQVSPTPTPAGDAGRTGEEVLLSSPAEIAARYGDKGRLLEAANVRSIAVFPLRDAVVEHGARSFGSFGISFAEARALTADDLAFARAVAQQAGQAMQRALLFEAEQTSRAAAEAANQAKSEFLANMSHELRTPLNAIQGYVQLLELELRGPVTEAQRGDLARIQQSQRHLLRLINDILNFAKIDAGHIDYELAPVSIAEVLADVVPMIELQAQAKDIRLEISLPAESPVALVDREKLGQVVLNLLSNAVKFTPRGGRVAIDAPTRADGDSRADRVDLRVADTGPGIPRAQQERIFDPFVQVPSGLAHRQEGTGLGLAISRDLVRGMGGELRVRSEPPHGAAFTISLQKA